MSILGGNERIAAIQRALDSMTSPEQVKQFMAMHRNDAVAVSMADQKLQQMTRPQATPPQPTVVDQKLQGVAALNPGAAVPEQGYAGGGIIAFAAGDKVEEKMSRQQAFARKYQAVAERAAKQLGVDPGIIIAHWGHESDWGKKPVGDYNFGNIKDFSKAGTGTAATDTREGSKDRYRNYDSPEAFADDYAAQIKKNWPEAVGAGGDSKKFLEGLDKGRLGKYATDPDYKENMRRVIAQAHKFMPIGTAEANTERAPQAVTNAAPDLNRYPTGNEMVLGAGETALQYGTGLADMIASGVKGLYYGATGKGDAEKTANESMGSWTYAPRSYGGQYVSDATRRLMDDLKIPPYLGHMGPTRRISPVTKAPAGITALEAAAKAAEEKVAPLRLTGPTKGQQPRLPAPNKATLVGDQQGTVTQGPPVQGAGVAGQAADAAADAAATQRGLAALAEDQARAKALRAAADKEVKPGTPIGPIALPEGAVLPPETRLGMIGATANDVARTQPPEEDADNTGLAALAARKEKPSEGTAEEYEPPEEKPTVPVEDRTGTPVAPKSRFSDDDWLMAGLHMLQAASKPGATALGSIGEGGIAGLTNKRQRLSDEAKQALEQAQIGHYKDMGEYYRGQVDVKQQLADLKKNADSAATLRVAAQLLNAERKDPMNVLNRMGLTGPELEAAWDRRLQQLLAQFGSGATIPQAGAVVPGVKPGWSAAGP